MCKGPGVIGFGSNSGSCRATGASAWTREIDRDIRLSEEQIKSGKIKDARAALKDLRDKYGL